MIRTETMEERMNRATRCKTCGMPLLPVEREYKNNGGGTRFKITTPKTYCNKDCWRAWQSNHPEVKEIGQWWQC